MTAHRSGFVAIVGRPNVGKSTFLNRVLGEKIAITSPKPQTTRNRILGVLTRPEWQIAFLDTPGVHRARGALNRAMLDTALAALEEVDASLVMVEPEPLGGEAERLIVERVRAGGKPAALAINKIDTIAKPALLPVIEAWRREHAWAEIVPISATLGDGVEELVSALVRILPEAPPMYPPDVMTDQAERQLAAEYVREQVLRLTREEVPYSVAVAVESFDESRRAGGEGPGLVHIEATVYVERDSQKGILIGKGGRMLKEIGTRARREIERLLGCKVFLGLRVKVEPDWTTRDASVARLGYGRSG